jgi:hypothetical protein
LQGKENTKYNATQFYSTVFFLGQWIGSLGQKEGRKEGRNTNSKVAMGQAQIMFDSLAKSSFCEANPRECNGFRTMGGTDTSEPAVS